MYLSVLDGKVLFGIYIIDILTSDKDYKFPILKKEQDKIICYSEEELLKIEAKLKELQISYTVEPIMFTDEQKQKVLNKSFKSRTEAIKYINNEIEEPESEIIPTLKREKKELELRLKQTESALLTVMFGRKE